MGFPVLGSRWPLDFRQLRDLLPANLANSANGNGPGWEIAISFLLASIRVIRGQSSTAYTGVILVGGVSRYFSDRRGIVAR